MRQIVFDTFPSWSEHYEGHLPFFYLDVKRLVTIGVGNLVDPCPYGLDFNGASEQEIQVAWFNVKHDKTLDSNNGGAQYGQLTTIRMTDAGIASLVRAKMLDMERTLKNYLLNWESSPAMAQRAAMSHAWAFGPAFPLKWPAWRMCFNAGDYAGASVQDVPNPAEMAIQNVSFHARIAAEQALLANTLQFDPNYLPM